MAALPTAQQRAAVAERDAEIASLHAALAAERATVAQLRAAVIGNDIKRNNSNTTPQGTPSSRASVPRALLSPTSATPTPNMWQRSFSEVPAGAIGLMAKTGASLSAVEARRLALRELKVRSVTSPSIDIQINNDSICLTLVTNRHHESPTHQVRK
jgi:hypothetical protein